jgi:hypothetical protein
MGTRRWLLCDRWMRALHLYTGLFLVPWMTVYAVSAFCLNHNEWIASPAIGRTSLTWPGR